MLHKTIYKFADRFKKMEMALASMGKDIEKCTLEEMDAIWNKVKKGILQRNTITRTSWKRHKKKKSNEEFRSMKFLSTFLNLE